MTNAWFPLACPSILLAAPNFIFVNKFPSQPLHSLFFGLECSSFSLFLFLRLLRNSTSRSLAPNVFVRQCQHLAHGANRRPARTIWVRCPSYWYSCLQCVPPCPASSIFILGLLFPPEHLLFLKHSFSNSQALPWQSDLLS